MPSLEVQLRIAAEQGDLPKVQELLAAGAHPDGVRESNGRTPLYRAASRDHREIVRLLLERGADPNREAGIHGTAMGTAKSPAVVRLLRAYGATQEHDLPEGECKLCGGDIDFVEVTLRWRSANGGGGRLLGGKCHECNLRYGATTRQGELYEWGLPELPPEWLTQHFSQEEVDALSTRLQRYPALGKDWQQFLDEQKPNDELWRYQNPSDDYPGVALLRRGIVIGVFSHAGVKL